MTDEPTTKKPVARCPHCKISFFNNPIDTDAHSRYCPVLLSRKISNLTTANEKLAKRLDALKTAEVAPPPVDFDDVEELTEDEIELDDYEDEDEVEAEAGYVLPAPTAEEPAIESPYFSPAIDRDDDYDIDPITPVRPIA